MNKDHVAIIYQIKQEFSSAPYPPAGQSKGGKAWRYLVLREQQNFFYVTFFSFVATFISHEGGQIESNLR